ncbi:MAG: GNAT family N-acetyltransferase [Thermoplasmatota archaeon]
MAESWLMKMKFEEALLSIYRSRPCQVLPNALWKTIDLVDSMGSDYTMENMITKLWMGDDESLHIYWTRDRTRFDLSTDYMYNLNFALFHEDYINNVPLESFSTIEKYFRISRINMNIPDLDKHNKFRIKPVNLDKDAAKVSDMISRCYENIKPDKEEVLSWKEHTMFDDDLWVWVHDVEEDRYAGLGIAELDRTVPEASLEWIQVDPDYHGQDIGKMIVYELLKRVKGNVKFVTVSGKYDTEDSPKGFYESCGFRGNDIWYVLRNKS